jgi:hypothetical protein
VAVVGQVPFQPLFDRREDELIAYTFEQYLQTGDAEWPLLLPMVKSTVRAMDASSDVARREWHIPLPTFTVLGGSKRGWTVLATNDGYFPVDSANLYWDVANCVDCHEPSPLWGYHSGRTMSVEIRTFITDAATVRRETSARSAPAQEINPPARARCSPIHSRSCAMR